MTLQVRKKSAEEETIKQRKSQRLCKNTVRHGDCGLIDRELIRRLTDPSAEFDITGKLPNKKMSLELLKVCFCPKLRSPERGKKAQRT
jgi:hypothetical protein